MFPFHPPHSTIYSPAHKKWLQTLTDPPPPAKRLHPVSSPEQVLPATRLLSTTHPPATPSTLSSRNAANQGRRRAWWSRCVSIDTPEMGPAVDILGDLLEESQLVSSHAELTDTSIGRLLDFGKASDIENKRGRLLDTAAFAMGAVGDELGVAGVTGRIFEDNGEDSDRRGAGKGKVRGRLVVPGILGGGGGEGCIAYKFWSPIRQVCFAGGADDDAGKPYLAVRTLAGTTVFKQTKLQTPLPGMTNRFWPRQLLSIGSEDMLGATHAHVEFNPWYERQFGVLDEKGRWKVWDMEGSQREPGIGHVVKEYAHGGMSVDDEGVVGGWGRVCWGGDLNTVLVTGRKRAGVFDMRAGPSVVSQIGIPLDQGVRILDLKRGPPWTVSTDAFVLTSRSLHWLDIRQPKTPLMTLPHYRHESDALLSLELFNLGDSITNALIYSRLNHLITSHTLTNSSSIPTQLGPATLLAPPYSHQNLSIPLTYSISILPFKPYKNLALHSHKQFFSAFSIGKDLSISQRLYAYSSSDDQPSIKPRPGAREHLVGLGVKSGRYVVEEETDSEEPEPEGLPGVRDKTLLKELLDSRSSRRRTNLGDLYEHAYLHGEAAMHTADSIQEYIHELTSLLTKRHERADLGVISLLNLLPPTALFADLDALQGGIEALLAEERFRRFEVTQLSSTRQPPSIQDVYNELKEIYLTSLPANTPPRILLRREKLVRAVATETWLADTSVHLVPPAPAAPPEAQAKESVEKIRTYANVDSTIVLPAGMQGVIDTWEIGSDPWDLDGGMVGVSEGRTRKKGKNGGSKKSRKDSEVKRPSFKVLVEVGSGSQPFRQMQSSQTDGIQVSTQPERGVFGGGKRVVAGRKKRRTGF